MIRILPDIAEELSLYDLCIVGSGPVGMTLLAELARTGLKVCVLESGLQSRSFTADSLRALEQSGIKVRDDSRERRVGGSSETWSGRSAPLDPIDFEMRPYSKDHIGWPFGPQELAPYLEQAAKRYRFPAPSLFETDAFLKEAQPWQELEPKVFLAYYPQVRFGQAYQYLFSYPNLDLIIDATATELVCEEGSARVREVVCKASDSTIVRVRARAFVLAAGAIENARLLLNSKSSTPQGLGNEHDQVGRYLMNHPKGYIGKVRLRESDQRTWELLNSYARWKKLSYFSGCYAGLRLRESTQRARELLNSYARFEPVFPWTDRREIETEKKFLGSARRAAVAAIRLRGQTLLREFAVLRRLAPQALVALPAFLWLSVARLSYGKNPTPKLLRLRYFLEMEPCAANRVTLGSTLDALGVPRARVSHDLTARDIETFKALQTAVGEECERLGLGEMLLSEAEKTMLPREDASHHLGTTRMGTDPRRSVVDSNLRVHSLQNLFVAGGSAFPTSGNGNPTMMMVALSIRLAQHLREEIFHVSDVDEQRAPSALPVLLIGAGKRVHNDILPVLESLPHELYISQIFARMPRALFGKRALYNVAALAELRAEDIAAARVVYISAPPRDVPTILHLLARHDCSHLDLIVPTPVSYVVPRGKFKNIVVEEDSIFLPWIPLVRRASGALKKIVLDRSAHRYHAIALIKALCSTAGAPGHIRSGVRLGNRLWLRCNGTRVMLREPRDYATGRLWLMGEQATVTDRAAPGTVPIELLGEKGACAGFRVGSEEENLSPEESALFGPVQRGDTVITRMHDCKRVSLRRLLQAVARGDNSCPLIEGEDDTRVDRALHRYVLSIGR
jgi:choline dehydrogenase-like flavoprotein